MAALTQSQTEQAQAGTSSTNVSDPVDDSQDGSSEDTGLENATPEAAVGD